MQLGTYQLPSLYYSPNQPTREQKAKFALIIRHLLLALTIRHWVSTSSGGTLNLSQPSFASAW